MESLPRLGGGIKSLPPSVGDSVVPMGSAAPLGIHGNKSSPSPFVTRFALQSAARDLMPHEGVSKCLRRPIPGQLVSLLYAPVHQKAHYGGLQLCKSIWMCPVCAAKISERRRVEMTDILRQWSERPNGYVLLVTFTLSHKFNHRLSRVLGLLKAARASLTSGKAAKSFAARYGVLGMVRALEVTHGVNGWHPHLHVLYFFDQQVPIIPFTDDITRRWLAAVHAAGGSASLEHGCDVRFSDTDVASYVSKFGYTSTWTPAHELTKSVVKRGRAGGRTPSELLHDYLFAGDLRAGRLWRIYAYSFKGERQLRWSGQVRKLLELAAPKSDEQLAVEEDEIGVVLAQLSLAAWRVIVANDARGELRDIGDSGDIVQVRIFLARLGVESS